MVEQDVAETPPQDHPKGHVEQQVAQLLGIHGGIRATGPQPGQPPARNEGDQVGQAVPVDGQRSERNGNRIELRMYEHGVLNQK